ncbi:hypothetical protein [Marivirga arenosa]|uniref:Uncharacterized protein n=1 Tax=Marivirga arenosa TaxID=3059076 RepID=A0AA49GGQ5_9BACT|nr:hypothetical protein [Marivirga sp. BKB1-2]WKK82259.2 hypothetical protein QYS47_09225 [Marivirga sp. BKB1-2]
MNANFSGKIYNHLFYDTQEECEKAQVDSNFFINCHQQLEFIDEDNATIMLTDIIYEVRYTVKKNKVIIFSEEGGNSQFENIEFKIIQNNELLKTDDSTVWKEQTGESIW